MLDILHLIGGNKCDFVPAFGNIIRADMLIG